MQQICKLLQALNKLQKDTQSAYKILHVNF